MLDDKARRWLAALLGPAVIFDEPMARHTTFKIGGAADALARPQNETQLRQLVQWTGQNNIPYLVLGGGSNLLVRDGGIRGVVICMRAMAGDVRWRQSPPQVIVTAGAGVPTKRLCALALKQGWEGMNFALGIPGTVGGAVLMNAGTGQGSMADALSAVTVMTVSAKTERIARDRLQVQYRALQWPPHIQNVLNRTIVTAAEFRLAMGDRDLVRQEARRLMRARVRKQPSWQPSAGCFFKNPSPQMTAGRLIDEAGLKGLRVGRAQVSSRHANFIINRGGATAGDVIGLVDQIRKKVESNCGIVLQPEVQIVGEETGKKESL
jgi:UDP-N-acetylmuramate dehydrogenase